MGTEDLDEGDFKCWNLAVHVDTCQVKLNLETDIDVSPVNGRRPPKSEPSVGDLIQTGSLSVRQLLVLHTLFEATSLLPEKTLPRREVSALKQGMLKNTLDTAQSLNHVSSVVVEVPKLSIVFLVSPPEGVLLQDLILLEVLTDTPPFVICECETIFLKQSVDPGNTTVPTVLQII